MLFIDLVNDEEEPTSPTSLQSLCNLFELPDPIFPLSSVPPNLESPESPIDGVYHPMDVCPMLTPEPDGQYLRDTDLLTAFYFPTDPTFDPLPSPVYTTQELDDALSHLQSFSCSNMPPSDASLTELRQRLDSLEHRCITHTVTLEKMVNTLAVDLANLTQGVNKQLSQIFDLVQSRHESNFHLHRHIGDILASLACLPALDLRMTSGLLGEIQRLRRRTLWG